MAAAAGTTPAFDSELDAIFSKTFAPPPKRVEPPVAATTSKSAETLKSTSKKTKAPSVRPEKPAKQSKKRKLAAPEPQESDASDVDSEQEEVYAARAAAKRLRQTLGSQKQPLASAKGSEQLKNEQKSVSDEESEESSSEDNEEEESDADAEEPSDDEISIPEPELSDDDDQDNLSSASASDLATSSATTAARQSRSEASTSVNKQETREQQADRTAFIGNVPLATALQRPARKTFTRFLEAKLSELAKPEGSASHQIESIRFRSLPLDVTGSKDSPAVPNDNHASKRGQQWKAQGYKKRKPDATTEEQDIASTDPSKVFLTTNQKRKVAYITGGQGKAKEGATEAQKDGGSCSAYVVLKSPESLSSFVAAVDGSVFEGRTLRSDLASRKGVEKSEEKRTVFAGGIDVHESEENLRSWVEKLLEEAKGQSEDNGKWVQRVRIIRDPATGLGKGIAYVLLKDSDCVDELLSLDKPKLKLSKRKVRFERCKTTKMEAMKKAGVKEKKPKANDKKPSQKQGSGKDAAHTSKSRERVTKTTPVKAMSKAEKEAYGKKLASLSKDDRKAAKSSDADRVARRLQKRERKREEIKKAKQQEKQGNGMLKALGRKLDHAKNKVGGASRVEKGARKPKKDA